MSARITAEFIDFVDSVRLQLLGCTTAEEIEAVFSNSKIDDFTAKIEFLHRVMQIQKIYGVPGDTTPSDKDIYEYYVRFYLGGEWKDFI